MTRFKVKIVQFAAMAGLLIAGIGVSAALASNGNGPPSSPPGQGECAHGNSDQECKPDPQPDKGKDCEAHGQQGGVNEDHCLGTNETTTTHETTTTPTTTHETTTTTPTHETTTTTPTHETTTTTPTHTTPPAPGCGTAGKDGHPGNDDCATTTTTHTTTTTSTTPATTSTTAGTTTTSTPGTTTTSTPTGGTEGVSVGRAQGVKGKAAAVAGANAGQLPFTGFPAWLLAVLGAGLLLSGLGIRRFAD